MSGRVLIIGGQHDGQWIECDIKATTLEMPVMPGPGDTGFRSAKYTRREWHCGGADWFLYAAPELTDSTVFEMLLRGYRVPKERSR